MNFGESLAYWYLRLNGFIPMTNFVLHEPDPGNRQNADADLLAVRFPHVYEDIGGQPDDWDNERINHWNQGYPKNAICMICEVKTGKYERVNINKAFSDRRLRYAISRFGIIPRKDVSNVVTELRQAPLIRMAGFSIVKLLIDVQRFRLPNRSENHVEETPCEKMSLQEADLFIKNRMKCYQSHKDAARMFFPGDLIQYFAWSADTLERD